MNHSKIVFYLFASLYRNHYHDNILYIIYLKKSMKLSQATKKEPHKDSIHPKLWCQFGSTHTTFHWWRIIIPFSTCDDHSNLQKKNHREKITIQFSCAITHVILTNHDAKLWHYGKAKKEKKNGRKMGKCRAGQRGRKDLMRNLFFPPLLLYN